MLTFAALLAMHAKSETPVRATLGDGQVLMGEVRTKTLVLESGAGSLLVPLADIGEVVPVGAAGMSGGDGQVDVWLRNGSEIHGKWQDPKLAVSIAVGGNDVNVDLPMNDLNRLQLQGKERWPSGAVYRMQTAWGDDVLVDPAKTRLILENKLGTFAPMLSECASVAPIGKPDGDWRIELQTGTVLVGHLHDDTLTVALPMGPEQMTVPLAKFVSLRVESWTPLQPVQPVYTPNYDDERRLESDSISSRGAPATEQPAPPAAAKDARRDGWFDNTVLSEAKKRQQ
jgi:hypothetical protein